MSHRLWMYGLASPSTAGRQFLPEALDARPGDVVRKADKLHVGLCLGVSNGIRKARGIRSAKPRRDRPRDYARALELAQERGEEAIRARQPDLNAPDDDKRRCIVRIYYRSIGGEILACDSAPLSVCAANALERDMDDEASWALGTERFRAGDVGPLRSGARLVTLPSQVRDPVVVVDAGTAEVTEVPVPVPTLTLCAPPTSEPPRPTVWNNYHREAMARRAARFQAMHRRPVAA